MVTAFVTNQHMHEQMGPSAKAVPETLLSLRGLVSEVPLVSIEQPLTPTRPQVGGAEQGGACKFLLSPHVRKGASSGVHLTAPCWRVAFITTLAILRMDAQVQGWWEEGPGKAWEPGCSVTGKSNLRPCVCLGAAGRGRAVFPSSGASLGGT